MDPNTQTIVIAIVSAVLGSSGVWALILKLIDRRSSSNKMLLGLGYAEIRRTGNEYVCRGWITSDELRAFETYIYRPYKGLNGDGAGDQIWENVRKLPIREINTENMQEVCKS